MDNCILYMDRDILVAVKPAGMPSLPDKVGSASFLEYLGKEVSLPMNTLHPVGRLDRPVGGLILFSLSVKAQKWFSMPSDNISFTKGYSTLVYGQWEKKEGILEDYLIKNEKKNLSRVGTSTEKGAKKAILSYKVMREIEEKAVSFLDVSLITGRHHQIRVQMASAGHAVLGDLKYGQNLLSHGKTPRMPALFSSMLSFSFPGKKDGFQFLAAPEKWEPEVFSLLLP